jgi:ferredoxin
MKIRKEPVREDSYLNIKLDTYPIDFNLTDSLFYDFNKYAYGIVVSDGEKEVFLEYAESESKALQKHKEHLNRLLLRPEQWYDVREKKFRYLKYKETIDEEITEVPVFIHDHDVSPGYEKQTESMPVDIVKPEEKNHLEIKKDAVLELDEAVQENVNENPEPVEETKAFPENVPGLFYVDENCTECDVCTGEAPNFFVIENGHAHVFAQPTNEKELAECYAALVGCPAGAIHKNENI